MPIYKLYYEVDACDSYAARNTVQSSMSHVYGGKILSFKQTKKGHSTKAKKCNVIIDSYPVLDMFYIPPMPRVFSRAKAQRYIKNKKQEDKKGKLTHVYKILEV